MGLFGGGNASSTTKNLQNTGTASDSAILAQGDKNSIGNTSTNIKTSTTTTTKDSNNIGNVTVSKGGSVTYQTNGLDSGTVAAFGNSIASLASNGSNSSSPVVYNLPPATATANLTSSSVSKWLIGGGLALAAIAAYLFFRKKP